MQCEVELCEKDVLLGDFCTLHRKKDIADLLEYDDDGTIWDTCSKGHRWTIHNTHWESNSKGGRRRRCKICLGLKALKKSLEPEVGKAPEPVRPKDVALTQAMVSFDKSQARTKTPCAGKQAQWTDYSAATMPDAQTAQKWCEGCPFFQACANNAEAVKPGWGVWAGEVWVYGKRYDYTDEMREELDADD